MTDKVVTLPIITTVREEPNGVLEKAKGWDLERVIVIGADKDGNLQWGGSFSEGEEVLWLLECAKRDLMHNTFESQWD